MFNPISFIYDHWHSGMIGIAVVVVVFVIALVVCICKECGK